MLFTAEILEGIAAGAVTCAFRRWRRPTVRAGGTLTTPVGVLAIDGLTPVAADRITEADARAAGAPSAEAVLAALRPEGVLYRVDFHLEGEDPRIALRERGGLSGDEVRDLAARLERMGRAAGRPGHGRRVLEAVAAHPATPARELAARLGRPTDAFKRDVRRLKELGLTESLGTGYRVSPRGAALLGAMRAGDEPA